MKYSVLFLSLFLSFNVFSGQTRCGWLVNPTPANLSLIDRDGVWGISMQGRAGLDDASMDRVYRAIEDKSRFVRTNRNYGFSCACLEVDVAVNPSAIIKVYKAEQRLLKQCLEDPSIRNDMPLPME